MTKAITEIRTERIFIAAVVKWLKSERDYRVTRFTDEPAKTLLWELEDAGLEVRERQRG